ncbi:chromatin assembly factor 1 subunit A-domain-containing protein [Lasiosphaeria miniovina]|uniref:Chromatin assembly factor 1 subunit A-domain-containing protein n=1 Tax=Lasiosphaeria miniovina TaxID=1954250 RepID=A0AA40B600_9PEZI|nr:chromatin assembly factor 1 subunit A-domain-containing protein [Lasiosphaeria miniovina]KAK0728369.1 chromatin assembly factor 1 subunit A-domain-containing protein [Lasiosphaeria miniovina]
MPRFVQSADSSGRKRTHMDYLQPTNSESQDFSAKAHGSDVENSLSDKENVFSTNAPGAASSPIKSNAGLTESGSSPLDQNTPSPNPTPSRASSHNPIITVPILAPNTLPVQSSIATTTTDEAAAPKSSTSEPPVKKKRLSEEKAAKIKADEARRLEREQREQLRKQKKREKEEAEKQKAELKAAKAAEKEAEKKRLADEKEKKKRGKEEEEARKAKKAGTQTKLTNLFKVAPFAPRKVRPQPRLENVDDSSSARTSSKAAMKDISVYKQMFQPFFVKDHVTLASTPFRMDETRDAKSKILDEYLEGKRGEFIPVAFNPSDALQIPFPVRRGRVYPSVRKIMAEYGDSSSTPVDLTTESQNTQIRHTRDALKTVPLKSLKFREDVRPPYIGTISGLLPGVKSLRKVARNPLARNILPLNYEYDSEAEWQEEDGEDVEDLEDEEEDADNDSDVDSLIDDSEDAPARLVFSGGMEPESTGLCWEDNKRLNSVPDVCKFRMEVILESLDQHSAINPFETAYWETTPSAVVLAADPVASVPPGISQPTSDSRPAPMAPPPPPSDAFHTLAVGAATTKKSPQPLSVALQVQLKDLIRSKPNLSKVGLIELFASEHENCSRAQIKTSWDAIAQKNGKSWKVKGEA